MNSIAKYIVLSLFWGGCYAVEPAIQPSEYNKLGRKPAILTVLKDFPPPNKPVKKKKKRDILATPKSQ